MNNPAIAQITTTFTLGGREFDPDRFSLVAGRTPTEIWRAKALGVKDNPSFPQIEWNYFHAKQPRRSIDEAIRRILFDFEQQREQIVAFARSFNCSLHLSLELHGDPTVIVYRIERDTVELLSAFGCSVSFALDID